MATSQMAETELSQGLRLHHQGQLDGAARHYRAVLDRDPNDPDATCLLGMVLQQQGELVRAIELIGRAVALRPDCARLSCQPRPGMAGDGPAGGSRRGIRQPAGDLPGRRRRRTSTAALRAGAGEPRRGAAHFRRAVELDGSLVEARTNLGALLVELGRRARGAAALPRRACRAPDMVEVRLAMADAYPRPRLRARGPVGVCPRPQARPRPGAGGGRARPDVDPRWTSGTRASAGCGSPSSSSQGRRNTCDTSPRRPRPAACTPS